MDLELTLDAREAHGKANKRLRRAGIVPGIVFGKGEPSTPVQVDGKVFETLYRAGGPDLGGEHAPPRNERHRERHHQERPAQPAERLAPSTSTSSSSASRRRWRSTSRSSSPARPPRSRRPAAPCSTTCRASTSRRCRTTSRTRSSVDVSVLHSLDVAIHVRDLSLNRDLVQVLTDGETLVATVVPPRVEEEPEPVLTEEELEAAAAAEGAEGEGAEGEGAEGGEPAADADGGQSEGDSGS